MFSLASVSEPAKTWLSGRNNLSLPARSNIEFRTKERGGVWTTVLEAEVPNNKIWDVKIAIHVDETDEPD
jgi:hypothetical protein